MQEIGSYCRIGSYRSTLVSIIGSCMTYHDQMSEVGLPRIFVVEPCSADVGTLLQNDKVVNVVLDQLDRLTNTAEPGSYDDDGGAGMVLVRDCDLWPHLGLHLVSLLTEHDVTTKRIAPTGHTRGDEDIHLRKCGDRGSPHFRYGVYSSMRLP